MSIQGEASRAGSPSEQAAPIVAPEILQWARDLGALAMASEMPVSGAQVGASEDVPSTGEARFRLQAVVGAFIGGMREAGTFYILPPSEQHRMRRLAGETTNDPNETAGGAIDKLRQQLDMTQVTFAVETGVNYSTIIRLLNGRTHPRFEKCLLPVLKYLWKHERNPFEGDPEEVRLIIEQYITERYNLGAFRRLDEDTKARRVVMDTEEFFKLFSKSVSLKVEK